jgi:signal transduction histidine kinase
MHSMMSAASEEREQELKRFVETKLQTTRDFWLSIVYGSGPFVILSLTVLDYFAAREQYRLFLGYRVVTAAVLGIAYVLQTRKLLRNHQDAIMLAAGAAVTAMVALMIRELGGHESYYYGGIILAAIFCLGLIPMTTRVSIIFAVLIYGIYLIPILAYDTIRNVPFFLSAAVLTFACISALTMMRYISHLRLVKEFRLQYEVEQYQNLLEKKVADEVKAGREKDGVMVKQAHLASLGELAAGVTHEINTPLTYIKGNFELLKMELEDLPQGRRKDIEPLFTDIEDGIRRVAAIVESMKELSGHTKKAMAPTNIYYTLVYANRLVYNRAKHIAPVYLNDRLFDMFIDRDREIYTATVSRQGVEQVWVVIINNALDELAKREVPFEQRSLRITVGTEGENVVVRFRDNAGGIPATALGRIFDIFFSTKEKSGTGLGLYVARTIVESHGGTILAANEGDGAVFTVILPCCPKGGDHAVQEERGSHREQQRDAAVRAPAGAGIL